MRKNKLWYFLKLMTGNVRRFGDILCILLRFSIVILTTSEILPKVNIVLFFLMVPDGVFFLAQLCCGAFVL